MILGPGHSSDECKVLQPILQRTTGAIPYLEKGIIKKKDNHTIIDNMVYEIHMVEYKEVSDINHEAP